MEDKRMRRMMPFQIIKPDSELIAYVQIEWWKNGEVTISHPPDLNLSFKIIELGKAVLENKKKGIGLIIPPLDKVSHHGIG